VSISRRHAGGSTPLRWFGQDASSFIYDILARGDAAAATPQSCDESFVRTGGMREFPYLPQLHDAKTDRDMTSPLDRGCTARALQHGTTSSHTSVLLAFRRPACGEAEPVFPFAMIDLALGCIAADINSYLQRLHQDNFERVVLSGLVDQSGAPPIKTEDKIVLLLTGIDEEKNVYDAIPAQRGGASVTRGSDPIYVNLHVMFAATQKHYPTALQALSAVIGYVKAKPVFDGCNTPELPSAIRQMNFNLEKLGYGELSNLWGFLGASYLPSANYTIRMVGLGQRQVNALVPSIEGVAVST
jgi:hypothetical protein